MTSFRCLALAVVGLLSLSACSGASDLADRAREAVEAISDPPGSSPEDGVLTLVNETDDDLCDLHITDFDEPDDPGYDLIEAPLAPGDSLSFPYGSHPDTDDHNLVATAGACDGTDYATYHFSYHLGAGLYRVHPGIEAE